MKNCKDCSMDQYAHWLLRIALASVFLYHGLPKFQDLGAFAEMGGFPVWVAFLVALAEVGGPLLLLVGGVLKNKMVTRVGALALVPVMLGAIAIVHWGPWAGMEFQVVLGLVALYLGITGGAAPCGCRG